MPVKQLLAIGSLRTGSETEETMGSVSHIAHETRHAKRKNGITIEANGYTISLDIVDTPGIATKIDFHDFMEQGMSDV